MIKSLYYILAIVIVCGIVYILAILGYWYSQTPSYKDTRNPDCAVHEKGRIYCRVQGKDLDLSMMVDSFLRKHPEYADRLAITDNHGNINNYLCCCIDYEKVISFASAPIEIYTIDCNEYNHQIGFIDIVSTYRNGEWHGSLTSKLDSSEKQRIRSRLYSEVLSKLPMVKDTTMQLR